MKMSSALTCLVSIPKFKEVNGTTHKLPAICTNLVMADTGLFITPYGGLNLANQRSRKLRVHDRKLEGSHSPFFSYSDKY